MLILFNNSALVINFCGLVSFVKFNNKDLLISLQQSYISQQFTDVQNSFANGAGESREGIIGEIPSYSVFDFTISYKFKRFKLSSGINNLTNSTYFTRRATGYPGPGIIPSEPRSYFMTLSYLY